MSTGPWALGQFLSCSILEPSGRFPTSFLPGRSLSKVMQDWAQGEGCSFPRSQGGVTSELRT